MKLYLQFTAEIWFVCYWY